MATIDLITYDQKMVTPKDDALIHQFGLANGVLYGCDVTLADSNTLHITGGQGVIYGRQWEITEGDITVTLPASGSLKGRLYVRIDLSNTTNPIELLVQTDVTLPDLTDDDQLNVNNSVSELELCTFDVSSLTISNLVRTVNPVTDGSHADVVDLQEDISEINSSLEIIGLSSTDIFTPASGVTMSARPCYKQGKEIFFTAVFTMSNPVSTANTLGTFKDDYKPNTQYYSIGMSYASGADAGSASLVNAGNTFLTAEHTSAKPYLVVVAKYITN